MAVAGACAPYDNHTLSLSDSTRHAMIRHALARTPALILGACTLALGSLPSAVAQTNARAEPPTVKLSPRARVESAPSDYSALLSKAGVEAFLSEAEVLNPDEVGRLPRIVATPDNRLLLGQGDRAYARSGQGTEGPLLSAQGAGEYRVVRSTRPLRDPTTGEVLGHELQLVGKAVLLEDERVSNDGQRQVVSPAVLRIASAKEEIRTGDRLLPALPARFDQLTPSEPSQAVQGQVLGMYGNGVAFAGQNQVIVINRGTSHGLAQGHVLNILKDARQVLDRTDGKNTPMQINGETNGRLLVFRAFDKVAYGLILQNTEAVKVGDRITAR